jgi:MFS transporter, DHA1 family, multidrug resistance protein
MNKSWLILIILIIAPLSGLQIDMYAPSLPAITHFFATTPALSKFTIISSIIGFGFGQLFFGALSDRFGRKKPLFIGLFAFTIISLSCVFAPSINILIMLRFLQGFACSAPSSTCKAVIGDVFSGKDRMRAISKYNAAWGLGAIIAPVLGSYLQHYINWQANFYSFAIIGLLLTILALTLPETHTCRTPKKLTHIVKTYQHILSNRIFILSGISTGLGYALLLLFSIVGPFLIQHQLHLSVLTYGHIALCMAVASVIGSTTVDQALKHISGQRLAAISLIIISLTCIGFLLCALIFGLTLLTLVIPIMIMIFCEPYFYPNNFSNAMTLFEDQRGMASASLGVLLSLASGVIGFAVSKVSLTTLLPTAFIYFCTSTILLMIFLVSSKLAPNK